LASVIPDGSSATFPQSLLFQRIDLQLMVCYCIHLYFLAWLSADVDFTYQRLRRLCIAAPKYFYTTFARLFTRVLLMWGEKQPKNPRKCIASTIHQRVKCTLDKCTTFWPNKIPCG
ncbi:hypothetical protein T11_11196, partial [Trichinella zimbabwensis]